VAVGELTVRRAKRVARSYGAGSGRHDHDQSISLDRRMS
jgi:hypothetical protein